MKFGAAVQDLMEAELELANAHRDLGGHHEADRDVLHQTTRCAQQCELHAAALHPIVKRLGGSDVAQPDTAGEVQGGGSPHRAATAMRRYVSDMLDRSQPAGLVLLDDLRLLYIATQDVHIRWLMIGQAAKASRDDELQQVFANCCEENMGQVRWLTTRIKVAAPQALTVG